MNPIQLANDSQSNAYRKQLSELEPKSQRTYTPTQAVLAKSSGVYHWTPEGRQLFDFTSGVLVANLGHYPNSWMRRFYHYMGWPTEGSSAPSPTEGFSSAVAMNAYNAVTPLEVDASQRLVDFLHRRTGGARLNRVIWAASGSEAIQKALWAGMARDRNRNMILASRFGFHGKKGLSHAVTGSEQDSERDPRVRFFTFPMHECNDVECRGQKLDLAPFEKELHDIYRQCEGRIGMLITEPYLGGGGSYHPQKEYLQLLQSFCRDRDIVFILDEVQSNYGRTGSMFAFETYGLEPDMVVLGKGMGNGVPVAAVVGRGDIFDALSYGDVSDTWSANSLGCAAVLATIEEFEARDVLGKMRESSRIIETGLIALKRRPFVSHVRGEQGGMVWGVEFQDFNNLSAADWANRFVLESYLGDSNKGVHLLGPLSKKVVRIAPPLVITPAEAMEAMGILERAATRLKS